MLSKRPWRPTPLLEPGSFADVRLATPERLLAALPYLGLSLIFLALPIGLLLIGSVNWTTVLLLTLVNAAVVWWVAAENRREDHSTAG